LRALACHGPQSRAQLARRLNVERSTVGMQVSRLKEAGLLAELAEVESGTPSLGRPGSAIHFNPEHRSFIGVDFGVGHLRAVLMDLQGQVTQAVEEPIPAHAQSPARMADLLAQHLRALMKQARNLDGVTISVPGLVNRSGLVVRLPFLHWENEDFEGALRARLPELGPVFIDNDANFFARAALLTEGQDSHAAIYLWMDAGIGAGFVFNGALVTGAHGQAGEIGHVFVRTPPGSDRKRLEDVTGKKAIFERAAELGIEAPSVDLLVARFEQGDRAARQLFDEWTAVMSEMLASLASILDLQAFVVSGPMAAILRPVLGDLKERMSALLFFGTVPPAIILHAHDSFTLARACVLVRRDAFLMG
jgi:predicted NBD/HSP70 family sugar kinase